MPEALALELRPFDELHYSLREIPPFVVSAEGMAYCLGVSVESFQHFFDYLQSYNSLLTLDYLRFESPEIVESVVGADFYYSPCANFFPTDYYGIVSLADYYSAVVANQEIATSNVRGLLTPEGSRELGLEEATQHNNYDDTNPASQSAQELWASEPLTPTGDSFLEGVTDLLEIPELEDLVFPEEPPQPPKEEPQPSARKRKEWRLSMTQWMAGLEALVEGLNSKAQKSWRKEIASYKKEPLKPIQFTKFRQVGLIETPEERKKRKAEQKANSTLDTKSAEHKEETGRPSKKPRPD